MRSTDANACRRILLAYNDKRRAFAVVVYKVSVARRVLFIFIIFFKACLASYADSLACSLALCLSGI